MKRKHVKEVFSEENIAVKGTKIILEDLKEHPWCSHGPSILFEKNGGEKYYACAAFRNRKQCSFYMKKPNLSKGTKKYERSLHKSVEYVKNPKLFCHNCQKLDMKNHEKHEIEKNPEKLNRPSTLLKGLEDSKGQAQFHFRYDFKYGLINNNF